MSGIQGWISPSFKLPCTDKFKNSIASKNTSRKRLQYGPKSTISNIKKISEDTWTDIFKPNSKEDLAVHKKKVSEVEEWLTQILQHGTVNKARLLLLTGPAGCGKTATIKILAQELNIEICEWSSNLFDSSGKVDFNEDRPYFSTNLQAFPESQTNTFKNFLLRAGRYSSLFSKRSNKIILIEEFPNVFLRDSASFHNILRTFHLSSICPAVFIISDCTKGESVESRLFPKNLQSELDITNISFNPVAPTMLIKVINRINTCSKDLDRRSLSQSDMEGIASNSNGDIRNAINLLQFISCKRSSSNDSPTPAKSQKISKKSQDELDSNRKNSSLFLFHALGKVLYCKRDKTKESDQSKLPHHLAHLERFPLLSNPEDIFEKTAITADGFALFLHENYLSFIDDTNIALPCSSAFSEGDVLCAEWTARDLLSEYAASSVTRSLMFNLRPTTSGNKWRPLRKPQYYDINRNLKSTCGQLKYTFKDSRLSLKELQTDFLPYLYKIGTRYPSKAKNKAIAQLGKMSVQQSFRPKYDSLCEKEIIEDNVIEDVFTTPNIESTDDNCFVEESEDYVIEEFDDKDVM